MPRIAEQVLPVTGGVDTHAGVHVAAAVDQVGRVLGTLWGSKTLPLVLSWAFRRPDPTPGRPGRPHQRIRSPGPVADEEPEVRGAVAGIHQKIADLLGGPRAVRVRGGAEDMDVAAGGLYREEAVQALKGHRAVHVKKAGGEHRRGLRVQELPPRRVGVPFRRRRDPPGP
jgi:hypothetical protein